MLCRHRYYGVDTRDWWQRHLLCLAEAGASIWLDYNKLAFHFLQHVVAYSMGMWPARDICGRI